MQTNESSGRNSPRHSLIAALILLFLSPVVSGQGTPDWVITFPDQGSFFTDSAFTPDGKQLLLTDYGFQGCGVYDFSTRSFVVSFDNSGAQYRSLALSPDGSKLAFGCGGYCFASVGLGEYPARIGIWQERFARNVTPSSLPSPVWAITFSPETTRLLVRADYSQVSLVDTRDGREIDYFHMRGVNHCEFFPDGRRVFALRHYDGVGRATIYDSETRKELWNIEGPETGGPTGDGKRVMLHYSNEGVIRFFDLEKGGDPEVYDCPDPILQVVADGKNVLTVDGRIASLRELNFDMGKGRGTCAQMRAYELPDQKEVTTAENEIPIAQARFSPDGKKLMFLTGPAVYVWDTSNLPSTVQETAEYRQ